MDNLYVDMVSSSIFTKLYYFGLVSVSGFLVSIYYQNVHKLKRDYGVAVYATIVSNMGFIFGFATYWWNYPSALLAGILFGWMFTRRIT